MKHIKEFRLVESSEPEVKRKYYNDGGLNNGNLKTETWFLHGKPHRIDAPAAIDYYKNGKVERELWYLNDKLHRVDGPAWIVYYPDGTVKDEVWYLNDKLHRVDGPAWIVYYPDGKVKWERWSLSGEEHRKDGPAWIVYYPDGKVKEEQWHLNGRELTKAEWVKKTPGLSADELVRLSNSDPDPEVRRAAKRNRRFPEDLEGWAINLDDWT